MQSKYASLELKARSHESVIKTVSKKKMGVV